MVEVGPQVSGWPSTLRDNRIWRPDRIAWLAATGEIGSGVFLTGRTPPSGWVEMRADAAGGWLMPEVPRYGLIGAFSAKSLPSRDEWFYIGAAKGSADEPVTWTLPRATDSPLDPGPDNQWCRLFLACNRPPDAGPTDNGNGFWTVTVNLATYIASDICTTPRPTKSSLCVSSLNGLTSARNSGAAHCASGQRAKEEAADLKKMAAVAFAAWAAAGTALSLSTVTGVFKGASEGARTLLGKLIEAIDAAVAGGTLVAVAASDAAAGIVIGAVSLATAVLVVDVMANAASKPWPVIIALGAACLVVVGMAIATGIIIGNYVGKVHEFAQEQLALEGEQQRYRQNTEASKLFCCASVAADAVPNFGKELTCGS
ncbi:hypothetical protein [Rugosimonospora africana]|uniref:hypothetical protein n=1 Tax=Rugosimonospora africana TaxID=556532 RepID=UPI0019421F68|nr:hypothetical protein [Rugosimonospora africana]